MATVVEAQTRRGSREEADRVLAEMARHGLARGSAGLRIYVMAETPSSVILASQFAERFDGFSIGSNDLTQLVLGVDRDAEAPSNYPAYGRFLVEAGIDSMSLSPDRALETIPHVVEAERALAMPAG